MIKKEPLVRERVRQIEKPFGWIPRRFIGDGYIKRCSGEELLLYFFLVVVADKHGLSFYGDRTICDFLGVKEEVLKSSRERLIKKSLIAYQAPLYQVLSLPP